ncbi:hypothetical protein PS870_01704 [Pseudomonas fluorescens]|jgi:hypothetical protein|uniref:Uncharacterized protein n=1 Tax=Pseudomonas fluorescens TaxID=294 RepID=A0A5E7IQR9_PSEFL|nr:hypothetical protein [Pseudomonas fluorescens]VVO79289.1 hypothetical protein PS870_01704 [Pseudomonas fluorescens]
MTDYIQLQKAAAYAAQDVTKFADEDEESRALQQFHEEVSPETVLALIAKNERLERKNFNQAETIKQYQDQIAGGDLSLGMLIAERDQLKAENEALRREREGRVLCDRELFETLRDSANTEADEHWRCMATYRPLHQVNLDSVVKKCNDLLAAMGKGEQS